MYTLYFLPHACSLATQVILRELNQEFTLINVQKVHDLASINPVANVPVLLKMEHDKSTTLTEGAAIIWYLLTHHSNTLMPAQKAAQQQALQDIMFANATMHPAYSRLFFLAQQRCDEHTKHTLFNSAAEKISQLWQVVEERLAHQPFLLGNHVSAADILLTVYSRWGSSFPVDIVIGPRTQAMLKQVMALPNFSASIDAEQTQAN